MVNALNAAATLNRVAVFFFKDLHLILGTNPDPWVIRRLRDMAAAFPAQKKTLIFRSPSHALHADLVPVVTIVEDAPPTRDELLALFEEWQRSVPQGP